MSDISIRRSHALAPARARKAAEDVAAKLRESFDLESEWQGSALHFRRAGVKGTLRLEAGAVQIDADLGFMLAMMKPAIEGAINRNLDELFGAAPKPPKTPKAAAKKPAARKK